MIFMAYNNELKKRYIPLIGIMSIYLLYTVNHPYCSNFKPPFLAARF